MSATAARISSAMADSPGPASATKGAAPLCFVIDGDASIRRFLSLILHGVGVDTEEFADGEALRAALLRRAPDLIFLNIALESAEAIECVLTLARAGYWGHIQLMSSRGSAVLAHVKSIGEQHRLHMLPVLKKPFETGAVLKVLQELQLGEPPSLAGRIGLDEALQNGWIEFWYQPKIDLRRKQLVGVEALARARHPVHGVLMPEAFMPGATESSLIALSEQGLSHALRATRNFAKLGVNLRPAIDVPVKSLVKMAAADILESHRAKFKKGCGVILDIAEDEIITDLPLATSLANKLLHLDAKLAIDNFGRGYSTLARQKELPFAELKLDRSFVNGCGTDKVNAPLCKTVIDLAHSFGSTAVAIGIEKASDALALVSMGCDCGQGFLLGQPMPEQRFISLLRQRAGTRAQPDVGNERDAAAQRNEPKIKPTAEADPERA